MRILNLIRSIKAVELLIISNKTVYEIGYCELGIGDEKAFYQFMDYHIKCSPREIRAMKNSRRDKLMEKLGREIRERN